MKARGYFQKLLELKVARCMLLCTFTLSTRSLSAEDALGDDIMDIRPMRELGFWEANWLWVLVVAFIVLIAVLTVVYAIIKKPAKTLSAYERAMREIAEAASFKDSGEDKAFSVAVSNALRHYIEAVFRIRAPEQTTEEFLTLAEKDKRISDEALQTLGEFLQLCDLAKFARHAFGPDEREQLLATAKDFVQQAQEGRKAEIGGLA